MTFIFIISIVALLMFTAWFSVRPLISKKFKLPAANSIETELTEIYREKSKQLEQQFDRNELTETELKEAQHELETALAEELPEHQNEFAADDRNKALSLILVITLPVFSIALYLFLGHPEAFIPSFSNTALQHKPGQQPAAVDQMVKQLEQRLQASPEDAEGWLMLGRSYTALKLLDKAKQAYAEAAKHAADQPLVLLDYAEAIARANQNIFNDEAVVVLKQSLALDPTSRRGRWLTGIVALQQGDNNSAIANWTEMLNEENVSTDEQDLLKQFIALTKGETPTSKPSPALRETIGIQVSVTLTEDLQKQISKTDTLFIYARAAKGPPMPIAIERLTATELPITVRLDDNDAMMEQMKLSNFKEVVVTARISKRGNAKPASGDFLGVSGILNPHENPVIQIEINHTIP